LVVYGWAASVVYVGAKHRLMRPWSLLIGTLPLAGFNTLGLFYIAMTGHVIPLILMIWAIIQAFFEAFKSQKRTS